MASIRALIIVALLALVQQASCRCGLAPGSNMLTRGGWGKTAVRSASMEATRATLNVVRRQIESDAVSFSRRGRALQQVSSRELPLQRCRSRAGLGKGGRSKHKS